MTSVSRAAQVPPLPTTPSASGAEENGAGGSAAVRQLPRPGSAQPGRLRRDVLLRRQRPRRRTARLHEAIAPTAAADLKVRSEALDRAYVDQGITFSLSGQERPFPLDIVPRVISAAEWSKLQRGIVQRVQALEMFLADIYGDAEIVRDGVLPRRPDHQLRALPPGRRRARPAQRRAHPRRRHRPRPRRAGRLPGPGGQPPQPVGRVVRDGEPPHDGARLPRPVHPPAGAARSATTARHLLRPCAPRPRRTRPTPPSWCSPPASSTRPTSSTRCSPARWASSWSRAATCSAATTSSTCAPPRATSGWT